MSLHVLAPASCVLALVILSSTLVLAAPYKNTDIDINKITIVSDSFNKQNVLNSVSNNNNGYYGGQGGYYGGQDGYYGGPGGYYGGPGVSPAPVQPASPITPVSPVYQYDTYV